MNQLTLKITGSSYLNNAHLLIDNQPIRMKKNKFGSTIATYHTKKDKVNLKLVTYLDHGGIFWYFTQLYFFIISVFGIFDTHEKVKYTIISYDADILVQKNTNITLQCNTKKGNKLYKVRNKWLNFFSHKAFIYDSNGHKIACVKNPLFSGKRFVFQGYEDEILIDGDFFSLQSTIMRNGESMGTINREFTLVRDSFCLEGAEEDIPFLIALVIAIDNIQDKIRGR